jgi:osmotically-inducible protein OsmY
VEEIVMNTKRFLMSLIVAGLAALGGYGQEVRAEPPAEIATAAEQPVEAPGEATDEMRGADEAVGLTDDTMITTKVKGALLQDPGTAALAIGVETFIGGVRLSGSVDSVDKKQRAQDIAERVDGVIAVDNALSVK